MITELKLKDVEKQQLSLGINAQIETFDAFVARAYPNNSHHEAMLARIFFDDNNTPLQIINNAAGFLDAAYREIPDDEKNTAESLRVKGEADNLRRLAQAYKELAESGTMDIKKARIFQFADDMLAAARRRLGDVPVRELNVEISDAVREHLFKSFTLGTPLTSDELTRIDAVLKDYKQRAITHEKIQRFESGVAVELHEEPAKGLHNLVKKLGHEPEHAPIPAEEEKILRTLIKAVRTLHPSFRISGRNAGDLARGAVEMQGGKMPSAHGVDVDFDTPPLSDDISFVRTVMNNYKNAGVKPAIIGDIDRVLANEPFKQANAILQKKLSQAIGGNTKSGD